MPTTRSQRCHIALMLYMSILVGSFACGLNHASHMALDMAFSGVSICSLGGGSSLTLSDSASHSADQADALPFNCPICQMVMLVMLLVVACLLRRPLRQRSAALQRIPWFPRQAWPPANPRAP